MARVIAGMRMSLDGFINDRHGSVHLLYPDMDAMRETDAVQERIAKTGAVVMGRRSYEMADDYTGYEFQVPIFVVTHQPPEQAAKGENDNLSFTFVTGGVGSAVAQAKAAAGDQEVTVIGGARTIQQIVDAGLADELHIDVLPVLLGAGQRLFERLDSAPLELDLEQVTETPGVVHLQFRVVK